MRRNFYITQYATIFDNKKRLLVVRDANHRHIKGRWVLPGGHIDDELDPILALRREIKEETNLRMKKAETFAVAIKHYPTGHRFVVYYKVHATGKIKLDHENDAYMWITLKDMKKMKFRDSDERKLIIKVLGGK